MGQSVDNADVALTVQERVATATPAEVLQYLSAFTQQGLQTPGGRVLCSVVLDRLRVLLPSAHRVPSPVRSATAAASDHHSVAFR